jgi:hypothetical protein
MPKVESMKNKNDQDHRQINFITTKDIGIPAFADILRL